jgi:UDP-MurNAc hydroxylase
MRLRYVYSACTVIETQDLKIVSDPWFTPGIYDGSWFQYPVIDDAVKTVGPADVIYVSHIHPDHYDAVLLRKYLAAYPQVQLLIGETTPNYLLNKMRIDGFAPLVTDKFHKGDTECFILPNGGYEADNIDTAMVVRCREQSIVNLNDNPFDERQIDQILSLLPKNKATLALLPYAGAGPYPQTYHMDDDTLHEKARRKKQQFLDVFRRYVEVLDPARVIPFAGQYWLGGPLSRLNNLRGVPDATEAAAIFPDRAVVLADGGKAFIDLDTLEASATRVSPYDEQVVSRYLASLDFKGYDYEQELRLLPGHMLPLVPLLGGAYRNALSKAMLSEDYWLCIKCHQMEDFFVLNLSRDEGLKRLRDCEELQPRSELFMDPRYLFGLLTRLYHWNNAQIGSQFTCRRVPDVYEPKVQYFLNRFQV